MKRVGLDGRAAGGVSAGGPQVVQPLQVSALALPVADGVIDELELRKSAEIRDWEYTLKNALQACIVPLAGQQIHLKKPLIGFLLDLDQVRNRDRSFDLREIDSFSKLALMGAVFRGLHSLKSSKAARAANGRRQRPPD